MRTLTVILALLIAALPIQAGACVSGAAAAPQSAMAIDADGADGHDCCPGESTEASEPAPPCGDGGHCGQCVVPGSALPCQVAPLAFQRPDVAFTPVTGAVAPSHHRPLYRPPIS